MCYAFLFTLPFRVCFRRAGKRLSSRQSPNMMDSVRLPNQARRHIPTAHSQTWQEFASLCANCGATWSIVRTASIFAHFSTSSTVWQTVTCNVEDFNISISIAISRRVIANAMRLCVHVGWLMEWVLNETVRGCCKRERKAGFQVSPHGHPSNCTIVAFSTVSLSPDTLEKPWKLLVNYAEICSTLCL